MKHKYTLVKWLLVHTLTLSVVLVLTFVLPLESCWQNHNIPPVKEGPKNDIESNITKQKGMQDVYSNAPNHPAVSNAVPNDKVEAIPGRVEVDQLERQNQKYSTPFFMGRPGYLPLSVLNNPIISEESKISKQQFISNSNSGIQVKVKSLQTEQLSTDKQRKLAEQLLAEKEKVGEEVKEEEKIGNREKVQGAEINGKGVEAKKATEGEQQEEVTSGAVKGNEVEKEKVEPGKNEEEKVKKPRARKRRRSRRKCRKRVIKEMETKKDEI